MAASTINTECKRYGCMKNLLACFANCRYTMRCDDLRNELIDKAPAAESDINRYLSERGRSPVMVQILKRGVKFDDKAGRPPRKPLEMALPSAVEAKPRRKLAVSARPATNAKPGLAAAEVRSQAEKATRRTVKARKSAASVKVKATTKRPTVRRSRLPANRQRADHQTVALHMTADTAPRRAASLRLAEASPRKLGESRSRKRSKMPRRAKPLAKANAIGIERPAAPPQNTPAVSGKPEIAARPTSERAAPRRKAVAKSRKPAANGRVYIIIEGQTASIVDEQGLMMHLFSNNSKNTRYFEASEVEARVQIVPKR
ncbi:MAG: hypothetical protein V7641_1547 [Blastocatellia bacterium]